MREHLAFLKLLSKELKLIEDVLGLLDWDMQTYMPREGGGARAEQQVLMQSLHHAKVISRETGRALNSLDREGSMEKLGFRDRALLREMRRKYSKAKKVPLALVEEMARLDSLAFQRWTEAKQKGDFDAFAPYLSRQIALKRKYAECLGYSKSPYDALLDLFEPGTTTAWTGGIFDALKEKIVPWLGKINAAPDPPSTLFLTRSFNTDKQWTFGLRVLERIGFDFDAGRQDKSVHPFTASCGGVGDVRITTRLNPKNLRPGLFGTVHEGGHGLYEQGFGKAVRDGILGAGASCALHESQARLWENQVGRSIPFWKYWFPKLKQSFPDALKGVKLKDFYRAVNKVTPSFIRVEADEVTYALHIILRFEMERDLIEGRLPVKKVPAAWNARMKAYLGVTPPDHCLGVLQDVHWSCGYFGYFPSYALGNLYASQFYVAAIRAVPDLEGKIARGDFAPLLAWLRRTIHRHGRTYTAGELVRRVTKAPLDPAWFLDYLRKKYEAIYGITLQPP